MGGLRTAQGQAVLPQLVLYILRKCGCSRRNLVWSVHGGHQRVMLRLAWTFQRPLRAGRAGVRSPIPVSRGAAPTGQPQDGRADTAAGSRATGRLRQRRDCGTSPLAARIAYSEGADFKDQPNRSSSVPKVLPTRPHQPQVSSPPPPPPPPPQPKSPAPYYPSQRQTWRDDNGCCPTVMGAASKHGSSHDHSRHSPRHRPRSAMSYSACNGRHRTLPPTPNVYVQPPTRNRDIPDVEVYRQALLRRGWVDTSENNNCLSQSATSPLDHGNRKSGVASNKSTFI